MRQAEYERTFRNRRITVRLLQLAEGVQVALYGGDRPHIGAVGIADPEGTCTVTEFPGHREGVLCEAWTRALARAGFCPAVVTAGIHYDLLDRDGIRSVLSLADDLLQEILRDLQSR